jgi:hypothetical protein
MDSAVASFYRSPGLKLRLDVEYSSGVFSWHSAVFPGKCKDKCEVLPVHAKKACGGMEV